jgi:hypothetical protein
MIKTLLCSGFTHLIFVLDEVNVPRFQTFGFAVSEKGFYVFTGYVDTLCVNTGS